MSDSKYRTPIPDKEAQNKVVERAIDLGISIQKAKDKQKKDAEMQKFQDNLYTADPIWREARLRKEKSLLNKLKNFFRKNNV